MGTTEDEMAGWHHQLNAREFGWTPGVGDGQGGLACCDSQGRKELDMTERLNWAESFSDIKTKGKNYPKGESSNDANVREVKSQLMVSKQVKEMFKSRHLPFRNNSGQCQIPIFSCKLKVKVKVKSCPTLCDPVDCSLPHSSVHGIP